MSDTKTPQQIENNRNANKRYFAKMTEEERKDFYTARYYRYKERYNAQSRRWAKQNPHKQQASTHNHTVARKYPKAYATTDITTPDLSAFLLINRGSPCSYCGEPATHIDHVIPLAQGGEHKWSNIVMACETCNLMKSDKTPEQFITAIKKVLDYKGT